MNLNLKPCPHCGSEAKLNNINDGPEAPNSQGNYIACEACGATTQLMFSCGEDCQLVLAGLWNARMSPSAGWIAVTDRLPETCVEVLVAFAGQCALPSTGQYTGSANRDMGGWCYPAENNGTGDDGSDPVVTHWMPLPDVPDAETMTHEPMDHLSDKADLCRKDGSAGLVELYCYWPDGSRQHMEFDHWPQREDLPATAVRFDIAVPDQHTAQSEHKGTI